MIIHGTAQTDARKLFHIFWAGVSGIGTGIGECKHSIYGTTY